MQQQKLLITMKDLKRYQILQDVLNEKITIKEASLLLSLSYRHTFRLKEKVKSGGLEAILRQPREAPNKMPQKDIDKILKLRKELYYDFNVMHFMDKLHEVHNLIFCYETIRKILIQTGNHKPKRRRKVHRQRRRMPKAGMLVQMDSSCHKWLKSIPEDWHLIAMIDDATNEIPYAGFFPKDTTFNNMNVIKEFIRQKGLFTSLYVDKASHFETTRHGGLHYNVAQEHGETQIERALDELGINIITANSPQAKGRIEVTFRLFQDRLIKEMRLAGIKNYNQANKFLKQKFLPYYNNKFTHDAESNYSPVPKDKNLDLIFCKKFIRKVNNDNTVQFKSQTIQILPSKIKRTFAESKIDVRLLEDNRVYVLYNNSIVAESKLSKNNKESNKEKQIEKLLNKRKYVPVKHRKTKYIPPDDHPWRTSRFKNSKSGRKTKCDILT